MKISACNPNSCKTPRSRPLEPAPARAVLRVRHLALCLGLASLLAGCSSLHKESITSKDRAYAHRSTGKTGRPYRVRGKTYYPMASSKGYREVGLASWYGFESGNRTATGQRFNPNGLSAAHKTLPLPTRVRVTNLENGHSTTLVVNDRGPFIPGRLIDLSYGAARKLNMHRRGTARVLVEALN
jgi:rare lipoprotein A